MPMDNERIIAELGDLRLLIVSVEAATQVAVTNARGHTDRELQAARVQAAADLDTFSAKIADLAVKTGAQISQAQEQLADHSRHAASDLEGQAADFHDTYSTRVNKLQARVDVDISKAKQEFQDQRELCQKHAYSEREDLEARVDANIHALSERLHVAETLPPIADAHNFLKTVIELKSTCHENRKAFEKELSRLQAKVGADIHALTQRVHRAESLPPISDAQDILAQADDVKNTCDDNRKAFEEDFSRLQSRLQTNIGSLTKRVRTLESGPAPWDTAGIERKQGNLRLRVEALERTANAHPDNEHELLRHDFVRVDERLDALECGPAPRDPAAIDKARQELVDVSAAATNLMLETLSRHEHKATRHFAGVDGRLDALEARFPKRFDPEPADPVNELDTAISKAMEQILHAQNVKLLQEHPAWLPSFFTTPKPRPEPPT